jgi:hypothetical protein
MHGAFLSFTFEVLSRTFLTARTGIRYLVCGTGSENTFKRRANQENSKFWPNAEYRSVHFDKFGLPS